MPTTQPLPEKAFYSLEKLEPAIPRPVNPPEPEEIPPGALEALKEGEKRLAAGDTPGAVEKLERAVGFVPDNPKIRRSLGLAYAALPNWGKALDNLRRAVKVAPDDLKAQVLVGRITAAQKQYPQAIQAYRTALKCSQAKPSDPLAAYALLKLGELLHAEGYLTAALACMTRLGDWIDKHGREYTSNRSLRSVVLKPEGLLTRRGQLLVSLGRPAEAAALLRRSFRRNRADLRTARLLMEALAAAGKSAEAEKLFMEMAGEPAQRPQLPALAEIIARSSGDKALPRRIWLAYRAKNPLNAPLAMSLAKTADRHGAPSEAIAILESVIREMPGHTGAGRLLVRLHARERRMEQALRMLASMLAADPAVATAVGSSIREIAAAKPKADLEVQFARKIAAQDSPIKHALHCVVGLLARERHNDSLAIEQFRFAIKAKDDFLPVYEALAELYVARQDYDQVDILLEGVRKLTKGEYLTPFIQGLAALSRGKTQEAFVALGRARRLNGRHVPTLMRLAEASSGLGRTREAVAALTAAMALEPDSTEIYRRLFDLYVAAKGFRDARSIALKLQMRQPDSLAAEIMLARHSFRTGNQAEAEKLVEKLKRRSPRNVEVLLVAFRVEARPLAGPLPKKDFEKAADRLGKIIRLSPRHVEANRLLADVLARNGKSGEAAGLLERLYQRTSRKARVGAAYAVALSEAKQYAAAAKVLEGLLADRPKDLLLNLRLLEVLEKAGSYQKAQKLADDLMASKEGRPLAASLRSVKLRLYGLAKQHDKAIDYAKSWIKDSPNLLGPREHLVRILAEAKLYDKAQTLLDEWISKGAYRALDNLRIRKMAYYGDAGQIDKARSYALAWIKQSPRAQEPRELLVSVLAQAEKHDEAVALVRKWLKNWSPTTTAPTQPASVPPLLRWGRTTALRLMLMQQKYAEALKRADEYIKLDPKNTELMNIRASCLSESGRADEAMAVLEKVLKLDPNDAGFNNNLGYTYADRGIHLEKAEKMIRKALTVQPATTAFLDSLAWVFYKRGQFREAGRIFQLILRPQADGWEDRDEHAVIYDHAGDVFYRLGWNEKAVELWRRAVALAKKEKYATLEIRKILSDTQAKIRAVRSKREPVLAPPGSKKRDKPKE